MNDATLRDEAEERLLTAELAAVMQGDVVLGSAEQRTWRRFGAAALVLLGALVTIGVAWLARTPDAMAQDPPFDPVDPWYEHEWPFRSGWVTALVQPVPVAATPAEVDAFVLTMRDEDCAELGAALARPSLRRLSLSWRNDAATANVSDELWRRLVARTDLEVLQLNGPFALSPARLRELRRLPSLRHLMLAAGAVTLDRATAEALAELPRLRGLMLGSIDLPPECVRVLGGLPHLELLVLSPQHGVATDLAAALPHLRNLRALVLTQERDHCYVDSTFLRELAPLRHLVYFDVWFADFDDAALAALPPGLAALGLAGLDRCTPAGIASLRRFGALRAVRLRQEVPAELRPALLDVLRAAPLQRFDQFTGTIVPDLWRVLQEKKELRRLTTRLPTGSGASVFRAASQCPHLEELAVYVDRLPEPDHLAPLRDHPTLRRIVLLADATQAEPFPAEPLAALRASIPVPIDVRPR